MEIKCLKQKIENGGSVDGLIVFKDSSDSNLHFLCVQYIKELIKNFDGDVTEVDTLADLLNLKSSSLFIDDSLTLCRLEVLDRILPDMNHTIIVCKKIENKVKDSYDLVEFEELDEWCIDDYILSRCSIIGKENATLLKSFCKNNLFAIENELDKVCLFDDNIIQNIFESMKSDYFIDDTNSNSMFDLANSLISRDLTKLGNLWSKVDFFDSDPMWLISILISQYKTIIDVFLHPNSTPEYCGISQKRFNAIKYYNKNYTRQQLIDIFMFLNGIDSKLKSGELSDINLLDYVIIGVIQRGER